MMSQTRFSWRLIKFDQERAICRRTNVEVIAHFRRRITCYVEVEIAMCRCCSIPELVLPEDFELSSVSIGEGERFTRSRTRPGTVGEPIWPSAYRRLRRGLARRGTGWPRWRRRDLVKDALCGRLQRGDVARHLLLAGGELVDALPHRGET
jgi:hypothetical protein